MSRKKIPEETKDQYWFAYKPVDIDNATWMSIIDSWTNGLSDREAAFRASRSGSKVTVKQLQEMKLQCSEIADLCEFLQTSLVTDSKLNIAEAIRRGDKSTSKWLLERKAPEEFSSKAALKVEAAVAELSMEDKEKQISELMAQFGGGTDGTVTD